MIHMIQRLGDLIDEDKNKSGSDNETEREGELEIIELLVSFYEQERLYAHISQV